VKGHFDVLPQPERKKDAVTIHLEEAPSGAQIVFLAGYLPGQLREQSQSTVFRLPWNEVLDIKNAWEMPFRIDMVLAGEDSEERFAIFPPDASVGAENEC
jgi:hypothetical protein